MCNSVCNSVSNSVRNAVLNNVPSRPVPYVVTYGGGLSVVTPSWHRYLGDVADTDDAMQGES